jgi:hypothetical protein
LNDVWKYENDILKVMDDVKEYMDLNIKFVASNSIRILGEVKGSVIELTSKDLVIEGIVEITAN